MALTGPSPEDDGVFSEINVTPFVDVMLVLLVIFMVTSPLLHQGVEVNLPKAAASAIQIPSEPITVSITKDQRVFVNNAEYNREALIRWMQQEVVPNPDNTVVVRADTSLNYGFVFALMADIRKAGVKKIALVSSERSTP